MHWLSYGGGVNSTALAILLQQGKVPGVGDDWTAIFADTGDEQPETYRFMEEWMIPWFLEIGKPLVIVKAAETVLGRWQRLSCVGSRMLRTCTDHAKIRPIDRHLKGKEVTGQLIGIDAGEAHRARVQDGKLYPLVDLDIDRDDCVKIIEEAGFPNPGKSGCWHCPFMRVSEVLDLARNRPDDFSKIEELEAASIKAHPVAAGTDRAQWGRKPARYWKRRSALEESQLDLFESEVPCECYDG